MAAAHTDGLVLKPMRHKAFSFALYIYVLQHKTHTTFPTLYYSKNQFTSACRWEHWQFISLRNWSQWSQSILQPHWKVTPHCWNVHSQSIKKEHKQSEKKQKAKKININNLQMQAIKQYKHWYMANIHSHRPTGPPTQRHTHAQIRKCNHTCIQKHHTLFHSHSLVHAAPKET